MSVSPTGVAMADVEEPLGAQEARLATRPANEVFPVADGFGEGEPATDDFGRHERFKWRGVPDSRRR